MMSLVIGILVSRRTGHHVRLLASLLMVLQVQLIIAAGALKKKLSLRVSQGGLGLSCKLDPLKLKQRLVDLRLLFRSMNLFRKSRGVVVIHVF